MGSDELSPFPTVALGCVFLNLTLKPTLRYLTSRVLPWAVTPPVLEPAFQESPTYVSPLAFCWLTLEVNFLVFAAHTTQFTLPGFHYLLHGFGVGHLAKGGSYVTLVNPDSKTDFTIVMETMVSTDA